MPALQVRDFPDDLYEKLKFCAELNHRSIAQQTIVAVEQMLDSEQHLRIDGWHDDRARIAVRNNPYLGDGTIGERTERIEKRKRLFDDIKRVSAWEDNAAAVEDYVEMIRAERNDRTMRILKSTSLPCENMVDTWEDVAETNEVTL